VTPRRRNPELGTVRWATVEELGDGRWELCLLDEADDAVVTAGLGIEGAWDPDVQPHVEFALARLGLAPLGARPWSEDEAGSMRAQVLPAS
jgi:hypothetical protein